MHQRLPKSFDSDEGRATQPFPPSCLLGCAGWVASLLWTLTSLAEDGTAAYPITRIDVGVRQLDTLPPGTLVGVDAPRGWSHLILSAYPRVGLGDVERVSKLVRELGALITFHMAAHVTTVPSPGGSRVYHLDKVGWGLGTRINGRNTIITYDTCDQLGADLGYLGNEVLRRNEQGLRGSFLRVAKTDSMIVCDYGAQVLYRNDHRWMVIRHAIIVSRTTGHLAALAWLLDYGSGETYRLAEERFQLLPPAMQEDRVFNVKADRFTLGIPANDAFAVARIPQGTPLAIPTALRPLAALRRFEAKQVVPLEEGLSRLVGQ